MTRRARWWNRGVLGLALAVAVTPACRRDRAPAVVTSTTAQPARPVPRKPDPPAALRWAPRRRVRVVLVGDTGKPGPARRAVMRAIRRETKDVVVDLGDLVYPWAPRCPGGKATGENLRLLEERLGGPLGRLGAPVLLVLGNHDLRHARRAPLRVACLRDFAKRYPSLVFPANTYSVDLGVALLSVINTNDLTAADGERVAREEAAHRGWRILLGHHVLRTYHDKEDQDYLRPWMRRHGIRPDLYANGHAHLLQFGVYDGIPAVTSGTGSKLRHRDSCPPHCGRGEMWGLSRNGYAVLDLDATSVRVTFKDGAGKPLWSWSKQRAPRNPGVGAGHPEAGPRRP